MAPSKLDRFKAAIKEELDRIPDKNPKPTLPCTPPPEVDGSAAVPTKPTEVRDDSSAKPESNSASRTKHGQMTPADTAFDKLTIVNTTSLDSDDSEAGCFLDIEIVAETEANTDDESSAAHSEASHGRPAVCLGPEMRCGQVTIHGEAFCPTLAIAKYPYRYVPKANSQAVASAFFDSGQFWQRGWDLFYVWPLEPVDKPIIFVREEHVAQLLKEVGAKFQSLHIDPKETYFRQIKLVVTFPDHPRLLPRYLGHCRSRDDYDKMILQVPSQRPFVFPRGEPEPEHAPDDEETADFADICETAIDLNRAKSRSKNKKQDQKVVIKANLSTQLKRAQRYFGLRKKTDKSSTDPEANVMPPLDVFRPPTYQFEDDVVIVCVDIEAWERSHSIITEVGVATLDTRDIRDLPPGNLGENWRTKVRARHFRIREHMMYENHEFVQSAPDRFEKDFGKTEIIDKKDASHIVASCFKEPFSKPQPDQDIAVSWENLPEKPDDSTSEKRNIIFLGNNPTADINYLHTLGYDPTNLLNLKEVMDTAGLYRAHKKEPNVRSVGGILAEFGLVGWNLHNAGNDAVYTMWIMFATIVAEARARGKENDSVDEEAEVGEKMDKENGSGHGGVPNSLPEVEVDDYVVPEEYKVW